MRKNLRSFICVTMLMCLFLSASAKASGTTPGSQADPLVSQTYVDYKFDALLQEFTEMLDAYRGGSSVQINDAQLEIIVGDVIRELDSRDAIQNEGMAYTPVHIYAGQVLLGGEGTEIILRSGTAVAWVYGQNGLSDVTQGKDITGNEHIQLNHLLIVPRADGRGLRATTECWLLVKGAYTITN